MEYKGYKIEETEPGSFSIYQSYSDWLSGQKPLDIRPTLEDAKRYVDVRLHYGPQDIEWLARQGLTPEDLVGFKAPYHWEILNPEAGTIFYGSETFGIIDSAMKSAKEFIEDGVEDGDFSSPIRGFEITIKDSEGNPTPRYTEWFNPHLL